ncbi:uncharacterized protein ASCRUDRAFT_77083 [Ascoidea rubescens DSM 1968]|uniref:Nudix hydrolase domain-containing protein n=1 Tax=Ascoidea rubescens DSM 1968 TaxID=1344418 RepID=A0A1D2VCH0_9ASCO|nr:hypothetical protein ASCRUDRAFT_77083 [Ascoidea rubescens DSM 1968]ODV59325.1 hypothetical protein ASCRUDRAFT_77083 [Ascoidea rubescens DSM 1968]
MEQNREQSFLEIVKQVDTLPYPGEKDYELFLQNTYELITHDGEQTIGHIITYIVQSLKKCMELTNDDCLIFDNKQKKCFINPRLDTFDKRSGAFNKIATVCRDEKIIKVLEHGWRNESYVIYYPTSVPYIAVERAFSVLLGVVTYGVHLVCYIPPHLSSTNELKFWIPKRSKNKPTFPSMLDNTVAGGIAYPYGVFETLVKESEEEASLSSKFVEENSKSCGVLSYTYKKNGANYDSANCNIQPETEYIYDIEMSEGDIINIPKPNDNEVEWFKLLSLNEVLEKLKQGEFKPNCALVIIDFLIRKSYITPENEPYYLEIVQRSHRKFPYPTR